MTKKEHNCTTCKKKAKEMMELIMDGLV